MTDKLRVQITCQRYYFWAPFISIKQFLFLLKKLFKIEIFLTLIHLELSNHCCYSSFARMFLQAFGSCQKMLRKQLESITLRFLQRNYFRNDLSCLEGEKQDDNSTSTLCSHSMEVCLKINFKLNLFET